MKKIFSLLLSVVMSLALAFGSTGAVVYAAEIDTPVVEEDIKEDKYYNGTVINTTWKTVAVASSGFNCNVYINCRNTAFLPNSWTVSPTDIRMLGRNGNVVWEESGAVAGLGNRTFWCGSDVYTIQARCQVGSGSLYIHPTD